MHKIAPLLTVLSLLFMANGCTSSLDKSVTELVESKNIWVKSAPSGSYSFVYLRKCFCALDNQRISIRVNNGKLVSASLLEDVDTPISVSSFSTIRELFDFILEGIKKQERDNNVEIKVLYDKSLGYPKQISYRKLNVTDGFTSIYISEVAIQ